jgi:DNA-binding LacI/PurR family transcriptional regulator
VAQPTLEDVARLAGVSRALVSLVIRESPKVSERSRREVLAAAEQLGYRPNLMARNLASRHTTTIGVLLNDLNNAFFAELADGILQEAARSNYSVMFSTGQRRPALEARAVEAFLELRVEGIILVSPRLPIGPIEAAARVVPLVVVCRTLRSNLVDTVNIDEHEGARLAVGHLVGLGHEKIVHIDGGRGGGSARRRGGYRQAMRRHGLAELSRTVGGDFTALSGARAVSALLRSGELPTAIFAANDLSATGALDRLDEEGLQVPDDISLVGYDNIGLAAMHRISLTTIDQPRADMGRLAVQTLLERIGRSRNAAVAHAVSPLLVVRRTTAPVTSGVVARAVGAI